MHERSGAEADEEPHRKGDNRGDDNSRNKVRGDLIRQRWIGARERCASLTILTICDSSVSEPRARAHHESSGSVHGPAVTFVPESFSTGIGSPLIIDSSTELWPSTTVPSTGIFSPGRTRSLSSTCTWSSGTSASPPWSSSRFAVLGARPSSARIAPLVWLRARSSNTCPRSTRATITAAGSKYTSICLPPHETTLEISEEQRLRRHCKGRRSSSKRYKRKHVEAAMRDGLPASNEEGKPAPDHHRSCQRELDPSHALAVNRCCMGMEGRNAETISASMGTASTTLIQSRSSY